MKNQNKKLKAILGIIMAISLLYLIWNLLFSSSSKTEIKKSQEVPNVVKSDESIVEKLEYNNKELIDRLNKKNITVSILGTDERDTETSRSDIIMVIKYYPVTNKAILISIPRDTRVEIPGMKLDKINHAFAFGGPELSQKTLENLFDISIDYYLKFSFEDFIMIVDDFEGVTVNAVKDFGYNGQVQVPKGEHILNGEDALFYVRYRSDSDGDFGRINRQQEVVKSLAHTIKNEDIENVIPVLDKAYGNMVTNMELLEMINYLTLLESKDELEIYERTLKTSSRMINGIYYGEYDEQDLTEIQELLNQ
ncbi:MAG: hypothetical protein CVU84_00700 [Firmicutes bacterium HGW-Firmicutes-1]|jgi:LCP family protein required for cell wall assembly|nr:MAG: hypothetical protein CVU84_00700 [Firmicutes bacterium HGW-Firmicutes-1]